MEGKIEGVEDFKKKLDTFIRSANEILENLSKVKSGEWKSYHSAGTLSGAGFDTWLKTKGQRWSYLFGSTDRQHAENPELIRIALEDYKKYALENAPISNTSKVAIGRIIAILTQMADVRLSIHPGVKTDFDFQVAQKGIANLDDPYNSFVNNITRERDLATKEISKQNNDISILKQQLADAESRVKQAPDVTVDYQYTDVQNKAEGGEVMGGNVGFVADYEGFEYDFEATDSVPNDVKFYKSKAKPGDLVPSEDEHLYIKGGKSLGEGIGEGWYKSIATYTEG